MKGGVFPLSENKDRYADCIRRYNLAHFLFRQNCKMSDTVGRLGQEGLPTSIFYFNKSAFGFGGAMQEYMKAFKILQL